MPITSVEQLREAIRRADIPANMRELALDYLQCEPEHALDDNAVRAFFWFGPFSLREHAPAILTAGGQAVTRDRVLRVRVTEFEHARIVAAAEQAGLTVSQYLRRQAGV